MDVFDASGRPVQGASLQTSDRTTFYSDERGRIEFLLPAEAVGRAPISAELAALGYLTQELQIQPDKERTEVTLQKGALFGGRVVDQEGAPIADAQVIVSAHNRSFEGVEKTDLEGNFSLNLSRPPVGYVSVRHPDYVDQRFDLSGSEADHVEIQLSRPEAGIYGRFSDSEGLPVRQFTVRLETGTGQRFQDRFHETGGRFEILDLPAGSFKLEISPLMERSAPDVVLRAEFELVRREVLGEFVFQLPPEQ